MELPALPPMDSARTIRHEELPALPPMDSARTIRRKGFGYVSSGVQKMGGIGICYSTDSGGLVDSGAETESDLPKRFSLLLEG